MRQEIVDNIIKAGVLRYPAKTYTEQPLMALAIKISVGYLRCSDPFLTPKFTIVDDEEPISSLNMETLKALVKESYDFSYDYPAGWFVEEVYRDLFDRLVYDYTGVKELLAA